MKIKGGINMVLIGIDPGLDGAIVIRDNDKIIFHDTPTFTIKSGKKNKRRCDVNSMVHILKPYMGINTHVAIEKIHSMPGQGVASMFSMGEGFGMWQGIIAALDLKLTLITPQSWKKKLMAGMGKEKDASRQRVLQLFPECFEDLKLKKHHGRADALLISEYLKLTLL